MLYPGDTINVILPLSRSDGANPNVTSVPQITIVHAGTGAAAVTAQTMTLISGTQKIYRYSWSIPASQTAGEYVAFASYVVDSVTFTGKYVDHFRVGDSRITGMVALDATVAKDASVAKDATVAKASSLSALNPDNSAVVLAIKAKTDLLPADPASETTIGSIESKITDIHDVELGESTLDKTVTPQVLTLRRPDNSILKQFELTDSGSETKRDPLP